jgi:SnoaL-like protein
MLGRDVDRVVYHEVRELWKAHSMAEDRRDIPGLIATLTDACVYEVFPGGARWEGHPGAVRFYTELITAFPDIHFDLQNIVIGPQGVCEEAKVTGTQRGGWLDRKASGQKVEFSVVIFFPWDVEKKKFKGERVFALL